MVRTNWSGNFAYEAPRIYTPESAEEIADLVVACARVKALGSRHSFNGIADSPTAQISLERLTETALDRETQTVTVEAGVTYGRLSPFLHRHGFALHNLASLPHISVVGACATATHGSGIDNGNMATAVTGIEMVTAAGETVHLSGNRLKSVVVGLGALAVVTRISLSIVPAFEVSQTVYENLFFAELGAHFSEIFGAAYSVSVFTDWQDRRATQVWVKRLHESATDATTGAYFFGATPAIAQLHPLAGHPPANCTEQAGVPGPWYERLPHFRMNFTPSSGAELQSEYFVPFERAFEAILAIEDLRNHITPHLFISELRPVSADELWMSPCYQRRSLAIHFTWKPDWGAVRVLLPRIEAALAPFDARPHWGKLFTLSAEKLRVSYPRFDDFRKLRRQFDPQGKFRNAYLDRVLGFP